MKKLIDYKDKIHSCSKCGLCQAACPIYKITGNDCTVSRGHFIMLKGLLNGNLKMSKKINKYLDLCLKCNACSKFCPSEIDVVDIVSAAKNEYFQASLTEKLYSLFQLIFIYGIKSFSKIIPKKKSISFTDKVIYFEGCGETLRGNKNAIKLLNKCNIEVITPSFHCCGIPFYVRGDFKTYEKFNNYNLKTLEQYRGLKVITTCASCAKALKKAGVDAKNLFEYIRENRLKLKLKKKITVTFHKPCNMENFADVEWILKNTENLEYIEMKDFDKCCGLNGILKPDHLKILSSLYREKRQNIINTGARTVLTSCPGCEITLLINSHFQYHIKDLTDFIANNVE